MHLLFINIYEFGHTESKVFILESSDDFGGSNFHFPQTSITLQCIVLV